MCFPPSVLIHIAEDFNHNTSLVDTFGFLNFFILVSCDSPLAIYYLIEDLSLILIAVAQLAARVSDPHWSQCRSGSGLRLLIIMEIQVLHFFYNFFKFQSLYFITYLR